MKKGRSAPDRDSDYLIASKDVASLEHLLGKLPVVLSEGAKERIASQVAAWRGETRVLVVDDSADVRDSYAVALQDEGYAVETAADGSEALDRLRWRPDVILLDLAMPVMDGYEFYSRMRALPGRHPSVIVVSGTMPDPADLPGVNGILAKPFDLSLLAQRVEMAAHSVVAAGR
jgi:CheY-like chemotaxis protein